MNRFVSELSLLAFLVLAQGFLRTFKDLWAFAFRPTLPIGGPAPTNAFTGRDDTQKIQGYSECIRSEIDYRASRNTAHWSVPTPRIIGHACSIADPQF